MHEWPSTSPKMRHTLSTDASLITILYTSIFYKIKYTHGEPLAAKNKRWKFIRYTWMAYTIQSTYADISPLIFHQTPNTHRQMLIICSGPLCMNDAKAQMLHWSFPLWYTHHWPFDTQIRISTPCIQNAHNSSWIRNMHDEQQSAQRNSTVTITTPKAAKFLLTARSTSYKSTENCSTPAIFVLMQNQCTRELITAWKSPAVTLTWHACKYKHT